MRAATVVGVACVVGVMLSAAVPPVAAQGPAGPEFLVSASTTARQEAPAVAAVGTGPVFVAWWRETITSPNSVLGRVFDGAGIPLGPEFPVGNPASGRYLPSVAAAAGGFVVVWEDVAGPAITVRGQRFDAAGATVGAEFTVTDGPEQAAGPEVAATPDGGFVVAWAGSAYGNLDVRARRFSPAAVPLGASFQVNTFTTGQQGALLGPGLAVGGDGAFVVVWDSDQDGSDGGVFGQRFGATGARSGSEFRANAITSGRQHSPSVSFDESGGLRVAWIDSSAGGADVVVRQFAASGQPMGAEYAVSAPDGTLHREPHIVPIAAGRHLVTWQTTRPQDFTVAIEARRLDPAGSLLGKPFRVIAHPADPVLQGGLSAAADGSGGFLVAATAVHLVFPFAHEVYARRFMGLAPQPAAADASPGPQSDGNGVFEPGESLVFAPGWFNFDDAALTALSGTASGFTGPGPAVYSITDGAAGYGTVGPGASATCSSAGDCYGLAVTAPPVRPALHWDALFDEALSTGQRQRWPMHLGDSFADVPRTRPTYRFVETLLHRQVTSGCGGSSYCPTAPTTRDQMTALVLLAKEGAGYAPFFCGTPSAFTDVPPGHPFCPWIEEMAKRGVVTGCGNGNFCPSSPVTRAQTAVFVVRTLDPTLSPPACTTPVFSDVPASSPFCRWVEELARRGVVSGCGSGRYCPEDPTTREQMAVILTAAFGLTLYGP